MTPDPLKQLIGRMRPMDGMRHVTITVKEMNKLLDAIEVLDEGLGQIKSITDDCQHMSRFAATAFDEIVDRQRAKARSGLGEG